MIYLRAVRLDAFGRFRFRIELPSASPIITSDTQVVVNALRAMGVERGAALVDHAKDSGVVEIIVPEAKRQH